MIQTNTFNVRIPMLIDHRLEEKTKTNVFRLITLDSTEIVKYIAIITFQKHREHNSIRDYYPKILRH